jgi:hypothetical protein
VHPAAQPNVMSDVARGESAAEMGTMGCREMVGRHLMSESQSAQLTVRAKRTSLRVGLSQTAISSSRRADGRRATCPVEAGWEAVLASLDRSFQCHNLRAVPGPR